jgi:peptidoglycan/LPS O-acetylase OafA/YrhL
MAANSASLSKLHREYIPGLDGIRGLAVMLVFFGHSVLYGKTSHLIPMGLDAGYTGVAVFFVLSGYLITTLLLREEDRTGAISLRYFYIRRAIRLFPALWFYLFIITIISSFGGLQEYPWHSLLSSLLYVRNLVGRGHETNHLWSLSIEEQFYLIWPLVMVALPRRNLARLLIAAWGLAGITLWRIYAARHGLATAGALYMRSDFRFDAPLFGCVLALIQRQIPQAISWANSTPRRSDLLMIVGIASLIAWFVVNPGDIMYPGIYATVAGLLGVVLVLSQIGTPGPLSRCLTWWPLLELGRISYGLYLWQQLFLGPPAHGFEGIRSFPLAQLASFGAALVSYRFLESPLLRLKDRIFQIPVVERVVIPHPACSTASASSR